MRLELWRPFFELDKEWESQFHLPWFLTEGHGFDFRSSLDATRTDGV